MVVVCSAAAVLRLPVAAMYSCYTALILRLLQKRCEEPAMANAAAKEDARYTASM